MITSFNPYFMEAICEKHGIQGVIYFGGGDAIYSRVPKACPHCHQPLALSKASLLKSQQYKIKHALASNKQQLYLSDDWWK